MTPVADDRPNRLPWPPILDVLTLLLAYVLERILPLAQLSVHLGAVPRGIGLFILLIGLAIGASALLAFWRARTTPNPIGKPRSLEMGGIYRFTRNPMYLGTVTLFAGLALALPSIWLLLLTPVQAVLLNELAIRPEEAYLERRFGQAYRDYKGRVRRWL